MLEVCSSFDWNYYLKYPGARVSMQQLTKVNCYTQMSVALDSVVCPVATDTNGEKKNPASTVTTKAEYNKLGRFIIHKFAISYLRDIYKL